jgi:pilus assembly protein Flp/PilA
MYTYIRLHNWMLLRRDEKGASAVEYGLLIALIAAVIVAAVVLLGGTISGIFTKTEGCISTKTGC